MDGASRAPFPVLPAAIQICSVIGSLYPHLDIIDDKVVIQTGRAQLEDSLHALAVGSCLQLLGFYCCQFLPALRPLRREYLGSLGLTQAGHLLLLLLRTALYPDTFPKADPAGSVLGLIAAACATVLVMSDKLAAPPPVGGRQQQEQEGTAAPPLPDPKAVARARAAVNVATHVLWAVYSLLFVLPYFSGLLRFAVPSAKPYGLFTAVLTQVTAAARLWAYVSGRMAAGRLKHKAE